MRREGKLKFEGKSGLHEHENVHTYEGDDVAATALRTEDIHSSPLGPDYPPQQVHPDPSRLVWGGVGGGPLNPLAWDWTGQAEHVTGSTQ